MPTFLLSYFTCQLLMATFRELLHPPTSPANFSRFTLPASFSCQLFENYFTCQLLMPNFRDYFTCQFLVPTFRELFHLPTSLANFSCQLSESYMTCQLLMATLRELLHPPTLPPNYSRVISPASFSCQVFENYFACQLLMLTFRELLHLHQLAPMLPGHSSSSCWCFFLWGGGAKRQIFLIARTLAVSTFILENNSASCFTCKRGSRFAIGQKPGIWKCEKFLRKPTSEHME